MKPDVSDQERIDRWKTEVDEADRIKELHRQSRKQGNLADKHSTIEQKRGLIKNKGLTVEDFERAKQSKRQKNKTLSSNF
tara:strand:+ start:361 stop:600 length:240 start_codon:yes stop_codon:yes gene_type:complete